MTSVQELPARIIAGKSECDSVKINTKEGWSQVLRRLRTSLGEDIFANWFLCLQLERVEGGVAYLSVPTLFLRSWLCKHYINELIAVLSIELDVPCAHISVRSITQKGGSGLSDTRVPEVQKISEKPISVIQSADQDRQLKLKGLKIKDIQKLVASHYNISLEDILSSRKNRNLVRPRQIAMYLAKISTLRSLPEIARCFGGRDHTTVLHAARKVEALLNTDDVFAEKIGLLKSLLLRCG